VAHVSARAIRPRDLAGEMIVRRARFVACVPPAESAILLVALDLPVGTDDLVSLVYRPLEFRRRHPVVVKVDAHPVLELDPHLHGVVGVDPLANEALFLADGTEGYRLAAVIAVNQVVPVSADVAE